MARNIDSGRLSVMLWGQEIGQLCWNPAKGNSYFFFSPEYLSSGLDIAPLTASSKSPAARFAIYGNTDSAKYQKLPPFIADSLPDDWGNTLFDQWFAEHHYHEKDKTPTIGATPSLTSGLRSITIMKKTRPPWRNSPSSGAVQWVRSNSSPAARTPSVRMRD